MVSVLCINLKRRIDKRGAFVGGMFAMDVPADDIVFFDAYDGASFEDRFAVYAAAQEEFPFWDYFTPEWVEQRGEPGTACATWSYQKCLQIIGKQSESDRYILMFDHTIFGKPWREITDLIESVGDFDVLQMHCFPWQAILERRESHVEGVNIGLAGPADCCTVFSPSGARRILKLYATMPQYNTTQVFRYIGEQSQTRFYSVADVEGWTKLPLELSGISKLPDSEREHINKVKGSGTICESHFYQGQRYSDLTPEHFMGKRGEHVSTD